MPSSAMMRYGDGSLTATGPSASIGTVWSNTNMTMGPHTALLSRMLGSTANGKLAALKALHPAADIGPQRWPDKAANDTVLMQDTDTFVIGNNGGVSATWTCQMWLTPFPDCVMIVTAIDDPNALPDPQGMNASLCGRGQVSGKTYAFMYSQAYQDANKHPNQDFQQVRITASSVTVDLISNATTNQGMVYAAQFGSDIQLMPETGGPSFSEQFAEHMARVGQSEKFKKMVTDMIADVFDLKPPTKELMPRITESTADNFEIVKYKNGSSDEDTDDDDDDDDEEQHPESEVSALTTAFDHMSFGPKNGPIDYELIKQQVMKADPNHTETKMLKHFLLARAADRRRMAQLHAPSGGQSGYRVVFQNWPHTPQQVIQISPSSYMATAQQGVYMPLKHCSDTLPYTPTASEAYLSATVPHQTNSQTTEMNVLNTEGWNMGAIIFAGLHRDAKLAVKRITCKEAVPRADSNIAKFTEEAPPLDKLAQDQTRGAMGKGADAYPAKCNEDGTIVNLLLDAVAMAGVPIVSTIAGGLKALDNMTGRYASRAIEKWVGV